MFDMKKMIFITGFARGGTSWLRDCVAFHPDVKKLPREMVIFKENEQADIVRSLVFDAINQNSLGDSPFYVNKAPANAPYFGKACRMFPESKFIFIIRDPRDVFISHKRGNKSWMKGSNSTVNGCLNKIEKYYKGFLDAEGCSNYLLVKYEDLHQNFHQTLKAIYQFVGLEDNFEIIENCFLKNNFKSSTGRSEEDRDAAARKGVVNDWVNFLEPKEGDWIKNSKFWSAYFTDHDYKWDPVSYRSILSTLKTCNFHSISEEELLSTHLHPDQPNLLLMHDIDALRNDTDIKSVIETAKIEADYGFTSFFNFLPLDDMRYQNVKPAEVLRTIEEVKKASPRATIALHLNAAERFFPAQMEDADDTHPDMARAVEYLHRQIDEYEKQGIVFKCATAHGYGRRKKRPNNRDSEIFPRELEKRGIVLFDTALRSPLDKNAKMMSVFNDVGGPLVVKQMPNGGWLDDPETYLNFPAGGLLRFLSHPGNYDVFRPYCLGMRKNLQ